MVLISFLMLFWPQKVVVTPRGHFNPRNVKKLLRYWFFKSCQILLKICTLSISTVLWLHFWYYFDPQNLLWPSGGILTPQNVKKRPLIFRRCWILLKFCTKFLWILTLSGEPIILCLVLLVCFLFWQESSLGLLVFFLYFCTVTSKIYKNDYILVLLRVSVVIVPVCESYQD